MIDIKPIRNYMRVALINAAIIPTAQYAFEGIPFDPATAPYDIYIAEIVQPDNDDKAATTVDGGQVTIAYNVYTREGASGTNASYTTVTAIASVFEYLKTVDIGTVRATFLHPRRRVATEQDGWRLSPIDITVRLTELEGD